MNQSINHYNLEFGQKADLASYSSYSYSSTYNTSIVATDSIRAEYVQ